MCLLKDTLYINTRIFCPPCSPHASVDKITRWTRVFAFLYPQYGVGWHSTQHSTHSLLHCHFLWPLYGDNRLEFWVVHESRRYFARTLAEGVDTLIEMVWVLLTMGGLYFTIVQIQYAKCSNIFRVEESIGTTHSMQSQHVYLTQLRNNFTPKSPTQTKGHEQAVKKRWKIHTQRYLRVAAEFHIWIVGHQLIQNVYECTFLQV